MLILQQEVAILKATNILLLQRVDELGTTTQTIDARVDDLEITTNTTTTGLTELESVVNTTAEIVQDHEIDIQGKENFSSSVFYVDEQDQEWLCPWFLYCYRTTNVKTATTEIQRINSFLLPF